MNDSKRKEGEKRTAPLVHEHKCKCGAEFYDGTPCVPKKPSKPRNTLLTKDKE